MNEVNKLKQKIVNPKAATAFLLGMFIIFSTGFSHITTTGSMGMMNMDTHFNATQCQNVCNLAIRNSNENKLIELDTEDDKPQLIYGLEFTAFSLAILLPFVINRLYLLSSWKPPGLVILHGLFRSGL